MAKMLGENNHGPQCDCNSRYVSGASEKCNRRNGNGRARAKEKNDWRRELTQQ